MAFHKQTVKDIDLKDKRVLLRADYNVPIVDGAVQSDYRIQQSLPTIHYLLERGCTVILTSHLGRPDGAVKNEFSLKLVAKRLSELLKKPVQFVTDSVGDDVKQAVSQAKPGDVLLLENVRFYPGEEKNDETFAKQLVESSGAEVFVQDCFGVAHRNHASITGVTKLLPAVAGLLLEKEVDTITEVMQNPKRPLMAIIGGAKIADKIEILDRLIDIADIVAVGGAMANTFLAARGIDIAKSMHEESEAQLARDIMAKADKKSKTQKFVFYLPQDGVVANKVDSKAATRIVDWGAHLLADIENYPKRPPESAATIAQDEMILDIGPCSGSFMAGAMQLANTVIWNGTLGVTEVKGLQGPVGPFAHGTELIVEAMVGDHGNKPFTLVGGGDTVGYVEERKLADSFGHVSTGGGASLDLMSGKKLPGVEALLDKTGAK